MCFSRLTGPISRQAYFRQNFSEVRSGPIGVFQNSPLSVCAIHPFHTMGANKRGSEAVDPI